MTLSAPSPAPGRTWPNAGAAGRRSDVRSVIDAMRRGAPVILAQGQGADSLIFVVAAGRDIGADTVNRMARDGRGIVSLAVSQRQARLLGLERQAYGDARRWSWGVTASIEARDGVETGISAADRARTIAVASAVDATSDELVTPGHVFPVMTHAGGLVAWQAIAEAAVEAAVLAERGEAAAYCHILTDTGEPATLADLPSLVALRDLPVAAFSELLVLRHQVGDSFGELFAAAFQ